VDPGDVDPVVAGPELRRLGTYRGLAREVGWLAFNTTLWPVGLVDEAARAALHRLRSRPTPELDPPGVVDPDAAEVPIVLIHGYFHNRSGMLLMRRALRRHGFLRVHTFSYNPLRKSIPQIAKSLERKVEAIVDGCGISRTHLVGHSLGGLIARYYTEHLGGHHLVDALISLGTPHQGTVLARAGRSITAKQMRPGSDFLNLMASTVKPRSVRYFSYYSNLDLLVVPSGSAILENGDGSRVRNVLVHDLGHLSLLINSELIDSIAENLSEAGPAAAPVTLSS